MSLGMMRHDVIESLSSSVRVSGSPMVDMMLATLVSGLLLQYLPLLCKWSASVINTIVRLLVSNYFLLGLRQYRHSVQITATTANSGTINPVERNRDGSIASAFQSPNTQSIDNLPLILGTLHHFQLNRVHFEQSGHQIAHLQPCLQLSTIREKLQHSSMSFIPEAAVVYQGMRFTFHTDHKQQSDKADSGQNNNNYDEDDEDGNQRRNRAVATQVSSLSMLVEGNYLEKIESFLAQRLAEEIDLAYPKHAEDNQSFLFELDERELSHANGYVVIQYLRSPFVTRKTFRTLFFPQKEQLLNTLAHFMAKTGPWDQKKERPHKLVILLEGLPGTGKSSIIKALANLTQRHLVCLNAASIKDDAMLVRLFRDESLSFIANTKHRNEVISHDRRLMIFEDLDCSGKSDWLMDRANKKSQRELDDDESVTISDALLHEVKSMRKGKKGFGPSSPSGPTLGGFLNTLDGVCELNGHIVVLTTNHANLFDPALLRPGRVDFRLSMEYIAIKNLVEMLEHVFDDVLELKHVTILTELVTNAKWTASQVQEIVQSAQNIEQAVDLLIKAAKT